MIEEALKYHSQVYRLEWKEVIVVYAETIEITLIRKPFTDEMIFDFQDKIDKYYEKQIALTERNGMTNYIHFMESGCITYYLFKYRNLYQFLQQGFEAMMGKSKQFIIGAHRAEVMVLLRKIGATFQKWLTIFYE